MMEPLGWPGVLRNKITAESLEVTMWRSMFISGHHYLLPPPIHLQESSWCGMFGGSAGKPRHPFPTAAYTLLHYGWSLVLEVLRAGMRMLLLGHFFSSHRIQRNDEAEFTRGFFWCPEMALRGPLLGPQAGSSFTRMNGTFASPTSEVA